MSTQPNFPTSQLFLGCAVWAYRGFIGDFYPKGSQSKDFLSLYTQRLTAVEGNTTFYALPPKDTLLSWKEQLPKNFAFCPKLDRRITHDNHLINSQQLTTQFLTRMSMLEDNLGPILVQLPPSFGPTHYQDLKRFLEQWPHQDFELALEVRHPGWWMDAPARGLHDLLCEFGVARVLLDTRPIYASKHDPQASNPRKKPKLPIHPHLTAPFTMVRFIAHPEPQFTQHYLSQWIEKIDDWFENPEMRVYFFSHCPVEEHSPGYAKQFYMALSKKRQNLSPLPWLDVTPPPKQLGLF